MNFLPGNKFLSNTRNSLDNCLSSSEYPLDFMVSGGINEYRVGIASNIIKKFWGHYPILILHNQNYFLEENVMQITSNVIHEDAHEQNRIRIVNSQYRHFEPFIGMSEMQIVFCLREMASAIGYTIYPAFERVVLAFLSILKYLHLQNSLSGLYYLVRFEDMGLFYSNVMALPCGRDTARRIWTDLCTEGNDRSSFDMVRSVILNFANEAVQNGWNPDNSVGDANCTTAVNACQVLLMSLNTMESNHLIEIYLFHELNSCGKPFILFLDDLSIHTKSLTNYLVTSNKGFRCGIFGNNVAEMFPEDDSAFEKLAEKMKAIILMQHRTGKMAEIYSKVLGEKTFLKEEKTRGTSGSITSFFPFGVQKSVRTFEETNYRVKPEEIMQLKTGQAIVFFADSNQILYY